MKIMSADDPKEKPQNAPPLQDHDTADERLDMELEQSFPASDPIPYTYEPPKPLHLEDFEVGQQFVTNTHTVTEDEIMRFAREFDPQPFHLDHDVANASLFRGLAASGWHTAALTMRLLVESGMRVAGGLVGVGGEIDWPVPTRPGDELRVETEVVAVKPSRSKPTCGIVTLRNRTLNQRNEPVQVATMKLFVPRAPGGD
jgi:acyl dehydratase